MFYSEYHLFRSGERSNYRIPTVAVTKRGTVLAFCSDRKDTLADHADEKTVVLRRRETGAPWEPERTLLAYPGWDCNIGAAVYDALTDTVFLEVMRQPVALDEFGDYTPEQLEKARCDAEALAAAAGILTGTFFLCSDDDGRTWRETPKNVASQTVMTAPDGSRTAFTGWTHGSAPGIQKKRGPHAGRLVMPSRFTTRRYTTLQELTECGFNNALYSDDHGATWHSGGPVQTGTGEGALFEDADGVIRYNSRAFFFDRKRYLADSCDGGESFGDFRTDDFLLEVPHSGCNASLLRVEKTALCAADAALLPPQAQGVVVFVNPRDPKSRKDLTACISFDDGRTWREGRHIRESFAAYSALAYSETDGHFYLLYELGENDPYDLGLSCAECDLAWLLG